MKFFDRVRVATATTGQGTITFGDAVSANFRTPLEAGVTDGDVTIGVLEEGGDYEIFRGTIGGSGTTITRTTVLSSKIAGTAGTSKIELGGDAEVFFIEGADHINDLEARAGRFKNLPEVVKTGTYSVLTTDAGKVLVGNSGSALTFNLPAVASSSEEPYFFRCIGAGVLTLDGNASETIEGATTVALPTGADIVLWPNEGKTAWRAKFDTTTATNLATSKTTPADADKLGLIDSAASFVLKHLTWANLKATMFAALGTLTAAGTSKATPVDADTLILSDSAASNATKKLTWANLKLNGGTGVINVAVATLSTTFSSSSTSTWVDTGLSVSITPKFATSTIVVSASLGVVGASGGQFVYARLVDATNTPLAQGAAAGTRQRIGMAVVPGGSGNAVNGALMGSDAPGTVAAQTYKVQLFTTSGTMYLNRTGTDTDDPAWPRGASFIKAEEVAA